MVNPELASGDVRVGAATEGGVPDDAAGGLDHGHPGEHAGVARTGAADDDGRYFLAPQSSFASQSSPRSFSVCGNGLPVLRS
jgi:hypothetical protein